LLQRLNSQQRSVFDQLRPICDPSLSVQLILTVLEEEKFDVGRAVAVLTSATVDDSFGARYAQDLRNLKEVLKLHGLQQRTVRNDGNCAFASFSLQLEDQAKVKKGPLDLRNIFVDIVSKNWVQFKDFFPGMSSADLSKFKKHNHWDDSFGDAVVQVLGRALKVHVRFYAPDGVHDIPYFDEEALAIKASKGELKDDPLGDKKDKPDPKEALQRRRSLRDLLQHGERPIIHLARIGAHWDSTALYGTVEKKASNEIVSLRDLLPKFSDSELERMLKVNNGNVEKTLEHGLHYDAVNQVKAFVPHVPEDEILVELRYRSWNVQSAVEYLLSFGRPDVHSFSSVNPASMSVALGRARPFLT